MSSRYDRWSCKNYSSNLMLHTLLTINILIYQVFISQVNGIQEFAREAFQNLTSRDPNKFWTSGQWMTERKGGSDVSDGTETEAVLQSDNLYKLYGYKWFSSATDSDMTITLARVLDKDNKVCQKSNSLITLNERKNDYVSLLKSYSPTND